MKRIEFSEHTNRLHRNLMVAASLIIAISLFQIWVTKASAGGFELENVTTGVVMTLLLAVMIYHSVAFAIRAYEEFYEWELNLPTKTDTMWSGGQIIVDLAH
jgi:hypothetical protein